LAFQLTGLVVTELVASMKFLYVKPR